MKVTSSLKGRVFLACAFVAVLSIGAGTHFVTRRVASEAEAELRRGLVQAAALLEEHHRARYETLELTAWLLADLPKLKAAVATGDGPTVEPVVRDYMERADTDVIVVTDADGKVLAALGTEAGSVVETGRLDPEGRVHFYDTPHGVLEVASLPIVIGPEPAEVLGRLSIGFFLNDELARELRSVTQSEVILVGEDRAIASTLPVTPRLSDELPELLANDYGTVHVDEDEYVALPTSLSVSGGPRALILRSRTDRLAFLDTFRNGLLLSALFGVLLAIVLSYAVARTVTKPLAEIAETIGDITTTGDLHRKIDLTGRFVDEDATTLARSFNRLTESLVRFQREAASKERLSALGRMSTIIAHEIRNPLMIVKASLRSFRRLDLSDAEVREAADDIDHEVSRINRIVGDVLDFAKPIKLDLEPTDINALCREIVATMEKEEEAPRCELALDDTLPEVVTDRERLSTALVNVLQNARDAVKERKATDGASSNGDFDIELTTRCLGKQTFAIVVRDHGVGIAPEDLPNVIEPSFTSKRVGTGLGLAIVKNIVDSLGGTVTAESGDPDGTVIRFDLASGSRVRS